MAGKHKNSKISAAGSHGGNAIKQSMGSRIFDVFNICLFILLAIVILFPFWNIIAISLTGNAEYMASSFILFPKKPTLEAYKYRKFVIFAHCLQLVFLFLTKRNYILRMMSHKKLLFDK